ncbi:MAG TPA: methyltransferase [Pyrinomonadaceae bacterium]|nr:methyltransferase [Pyrinomonadaceae bacterium]
METNVQTAAQPGPPPQAILMQLSMGAMVTQALFVAAKLGVADVLAEGEKHIDEIAKAVDAHPPSLFRILRSLASLGVFTETKARTFANTSLSEVLRSSVTGSMRDSMIFMGEPWHYNVWGNMLHSAKTGGTAWQETYGEEVFDWFAKNPEASETFNGCMSELSAGAAPAIVAAYDFSGIDTLVDIAGGHGFLLSQILKANPDVKGILFDREHVIAGAGDALRAFGVEDRVEMASGDFFSEVPAADAYIMRHIIHDWDDERAIKILQTIRQAMKDDGKLLIAEMVIPVGNEPHPGKMLDLEMLTAPGGMERNEAEYAKLFEGSGLQLNKVVPTASPFSVIEAVKA